MDNEKLKSFSRIFKCHGLSLTDDDIRYIFQVVEESFEISEGEVEILDSDHRKWRKATNDNDRSWAKNLEI